MKLHLLGLVFGLAMLTIACSKSPELVPLNQTLPGAVTPPASTTTSPASGTTPPGSTTTTTPSSGTDGGAMASLTLISKGTFINGAHSVSGMVSRYRNGSTGQQYLYFENFSSAGGPELHVYLAEGRSVTNFIDVSLLTNSGTFYYEIPAGSTSAQQTVLIWCRPYSVLFGSAELKPL